MPESPLGSSIGPNHRRVLSVRLRLLEEYCLHLTELFYPIEGALVSRAGLAPEKAEAVKSSVERFRSKLAKVMIDLDLERTSRNVQREAAALVATMITDVEELDPHFLAGYGHVPESLRSYLEESLASLIAILEDLDRTLAEKP